MDTFVVRINEYFCRLSVRYYTLDLNKSKLRSRYQKSKAPELGLFLLVRRFRIVILLGRFPHNDYNVIILVIS